MLEVTLVSAGEQAIKPLIEAALANEQRLLTIGLRKTQQRLQTFEQRFVLPTAEFVNKYANNEIAETLDTIEWLGEYRLAQRIQTKIDTLKAIRFAN